MVVGSTLVQPDRYNSHDNGSVTEQQRLNMSNTLNTSNSSEDLSLSLIGDRRWSIVLFSSRESSDTLSKSIEAALGASRNAPTVLDVVVNGNRSAADGIAQLLDSLTAGDQGEAKLVRTWYLDVADKAHAWNTYVHAIWPGSDVAFFLDGYVRVRPDSLSLLAEGLQTSPRMLAASGVPTVGRTATRVKNDMLREGAIHGNMYALRQDVLRQLRLRGIRLPIGLYGYDALIGAFICFGLDPVGNQWDCGRILVHAQATWTNTPLAWWKPSAIVKHGKRMMRQARRTLVNRAVHEHMGVQRRSPEQLPVTVTELIESWVRGSPVRARAQYLLNPLSFVAMRKLPSRRDLSAIAGVRPLLLGQAKIVPQLPSRAGP
jgi:hypothetical protein